MSEQCCVDRLEQETAVLQRWDESCFEIPIQQLPKGIREGDVVFWQDDAWCIDKRATQQRQAKLQDLLHRLGQEL